MDGERLKKDFSHVSGIEKKKGMKTFDESLLPTNYPRSETKTGGRQEKRKSGISSGVKSCY